MRKLFFAIIFFAYVACIISQDSYAIGVSPEGISGGALNLSVLTVFRFDVRNINPSPYRLNLTFELTPTSKYLSHNVVFSPQNIVIEKDMENADFYLIIGGSISEGDHLLVFVPRVNILDDPEINGSANISGAGIAVSTAAAYLEFTINVSSVPPSPPSEPSSSPSSSPAPVYEMRSTSTNMVQNKSNATLIIITESPGIVIDVPKFVKAADPGVTIKIKIKNVGDKTRDLLLNLSAAPPLSFRYDPVIGHLNSGEEKEVDVTIGNFTSSEHLVDVLVSEKGLNNSWSAAINVIVPEKPRGIAGENCIEYYPKNFTIDAYQESGISLNIKNRCNITINNLRAIVTYFGSLKAISSLAENESTSIDIYFTLPEGETKHTIIFSYDEGETVGEIRIKSLDRYSLYRWYMAAFFAIISIFVMLFGLPRKKKNEITDQDIPKYLKTRIEKLKIEVRNTEDFISLLSATRTDTISGVAKLEQMIQYEDNNSKQIESCLKIITGSIEEKKYTVELLSDESAAKNTDYANLLKNEFLIIGKSIEDKKEILDSFNKQQKSGIINQLKFWSGRFIALVSSHFVSSRSENELSNQWLDLYANPGKSHGLDGLKEHILSGQKAALSDDGSNIAVFEKSASRPYSSSFTTFLAHLGHDIISETKLLEDLMSREQFLMGDVGKKELSRAIHDMNKQIVEEKIMVELLKYESEEILQKENAAKKELESCQKRLAMLNKKNTIASMQEMTEGMNELKAGINELLSALMRLCEDKILSKKIDDSENIVKMELEIIDMKIEEKLKRRDSIINDAEQFLKGETE